MEFKKNLDKPDLLLGLMLLEMVCSSSPTENSNQNNEIEKPSLENMVLILAGEFLKGPDTGQFRILRGGSWKQVKNYQVLSASRTFQTPDYAINFVGFRCALDSSMLE